ncbi:hypothetical protein AUP68_16420 [Ilyonectria robusta]
MQPYWRSCLALLGAIASAPVHGVSEVKNVAIIGMSWEMACFQNRAMSPMYWVVFFSPSTRGRFIHLDPKLGDYSTSQCHYRSRHANTRP